MDIVLVPYLGVALSQSIPLDAFRSLVKEAVELCMCSKVWYGGKITLELLVDTEGLWKTLT